jgi:ABC-type nitrate/sulfonate/bicarbonate transport system substrate-binding protein
MRLIVIAAVVVLLLFGWLPSGLAGQNEKIKIAIRGQGDLFPVMAAKKFGFFDKNGIDVELVDMPSLRAAYIQLLKGDIQFVTTLSIEAVNLVARGEPLRAIMKIGSLSPTNIVSKDGIDAKTACRKRIVTITPSVNPRYFVVIDTCNKLGVPVADNLIVVEAGRYLVPLIEAGKADAAPFGDVDAPFAEFLLGFKSAPFSRAVLPTRAALITTENWLKNNPDKARRIVKAIREAAQWAKTSPPEAVAYYGDYMSEVSYQRDVRPVAGRSYEIAKNYWSVTGAFDPRVDVAIWIDYLTRPLPTQIPPLIDPKLYPHLPYILTRLLDLQGEYLK